MMIKEGNLEERLRKEAMWARISEVIKAELNSLGRANSVHTTFPQSYYSPKQKRIIFD